MQWIKVAILLWLGWHAIPIFIGFIYLIAVMIALAIVNSRCDQ